MSGCVPIAPFLTVLAGSPAGPALDAPPSRTPYGARVPRPDEASSRAVRRPGDEIGSAGQSVSAAVRNQLTRTTRLLRRGPDVR